MFVQSTTDPADWERTIVLGARGLLGTALCRRLRENGRSFISLGRGECDIADGGQVEQLFRDVRPTLLFNCAAYTAVDAAESEESQANLINGTAVGLLARCCRERSTRLVHVSTDAVFSGTSRIPYRPDDPVGPISAYGRSKLLGEQLLLREPPEHWLIARTAWLFGEDGECFPDRMVALARTRAEIEVVDDQVGSPSYAADVAQMILALVERNAQGIYHCVNAGSANWYEVACASIELSGLPCTVRPISTARWLQMRPGQAPRLACSVLDASKARELIGWPARPWQESLAAFAPSLRERSSGGVPGASPS